MLLSGGFDYQFAPRFVADVFNTMCPARRIMRGASCAAHPIDHGESIGRGLVAPPGDVAIRAHQHEFTLVDFRGLRVFDGHRAERHAAFPGGAGNVRTIGRIRAETGRTKPRPYRSSIELPSASATCGAREPGRAEA